VKLDKAVDLRLGELCAYLVENDWDRQRFAEALTDVFASRPGIVMSEALLRAADSLLQQVLHQTVAPPLSEEEEVWRRGAKDIGT
jgi:hypothetical protein